MKFDVSKLDNVQILDRICSVYGFTQKIQLASHFDIAASSLSNRYSRDSVSYDFAAICALETGVDLHWILTGEGEKPEANSPGGLPKNGITSLKKFTLSEGKLQSSGDYKLDTRHSSYDLENLRCIAAESSLYFVDESPTVTDGLKLIDVDGVVSVRELTVLPGKKLHVAGGKVSFECGMDEIKVLGRVVGIFKEVA
ncbi:MAG: phage repressor protein CI [Pantoea sp.]|uniref:phage repressor protein CI n=1 Tax=Pantoea sp. TaxID=69393 RepID=UPI00290E95D9|nr:phage repressor protein CI [Pantoea sp.]MDU6387140.1 phage repressor protein CI [Pantoea sp.]